MKYPSDLDYDRDQEPTPLQVMRQEWQDDHAAQQEQIDEAVAILTEFLAMGETIVHPAMKRNLRNRMELFLDQNAK
jgi:hypothetical protein